ncbi:MAG: hypothetical protein H7Z39_19800 [Burkholderiaceae bacterium]|nr:hypothetical protein [Burkholderiaceae bacterium]
MLRTNELEQRFTLIGHAIGQASQACSVERNMTGELRSCIQKLDQQSDLAMEVLRSRDEARIRKLVDDLALLGHRARQVCINGVNLMPQTKEAVKWMHDELSRLKHQLH